VLALSLWGFVVGMAVCIPLGLLFHALEGSEQPRSETTSVLAPPTMEPVYQEQRFELEFLSEEWNASEANRRQTRR
jgi:hypothetical protein